ncbi:hypothetical protein AURDEDRAFT_159315 [Auricularia subglabra TFB-10046 SS5]|nr:hypothetical protein AURDEDRAFT_159315 [Auricularia subglabra TFB-10046 SS5]
MTTTSALFEESAMPLVRTLQLRLESTKRDLREADLELADAAARRSTALTAFQAAQYTYYDVICALNRAIPGGAMPAPLDPRNIPKGLCPDLLRIVFTWLDEAYDHALSPCSPAFLVAGVCRLWRKVALDTRQIWSKVRIELTVESFVVMTQRLDTLIARAGPSLDLFVVDGPYPRRKSIPARAECALVRAFTHARSLQLSFRLEDITFRESILPLLQSPMPELVDFRVLRCGDDVHSLAVSGAPTHMTLMSLCPNLRRVHLDHLPLKLLDFAYLPCLEALSFLSPFTCDDILYIQRVCPNLRYLKLFRSEEWAALPFDDDQVFLNLETLICLACTFGVLQMISPHNVPRLRELRVHCGSHPEECGFLRFIDRAPKTLQRVTVTGISLLRIRDLFLALPDLLELGFHDITAPRLREIFDQWARITKPQLLSFPFLHIDARLLVSLASADLP